MPSPTVSVVLPTYNRLDYLKEAVESVRAQTFVDWELFVVDDGSIDGSAEWVTSLDDTRIRLVTQPHSGHRSRLRNIGIALSRGEFVAFIDSDDRWLTEKLARQVAFHERVDVPWSYTRCSIINERGEQVALDRFRTFTLHDGWIVRELLQLEARISLPSVIVARSLLTAVGGFDESRWWVEDYELWLRLSRAAPCGVIDEPLTVVRQHRGTSFNRPEVDEGFVSAYRQFATSTDDADLRRIAKQQEGHFAAWAANKWIDRREWKRAMSALFTVLRTRPLNRRFHIGVMRFVWRLLRARRRSSEHAA